VYNLYVGAIQLSISTKLLNVDIACQRASPSSTHLSLELNTSSTIWTLTHPIFQISFLPRTHAPETCRDSNTKSGRKKQNSVDQTAKDDFGNMKVAPCSRKLTGKPRGWPAMSIFHKRLYFHDPKNHLNGSNLI